MFKRSIYRALCIFLTQYAASRAEDHTSVHCLLILRSPAFHDTFLTRDCTGLAVERLGLSASAINKRGIMRTRLFCMAIILVASLSLAAPAFGQGGQGAITG